MAISRAVIYFYFKVFREDLLIYSEDFQRDGTSNPVLFQRWGERVENNYRMTLIWGNWKEMSIVFIVTEGVSKQKNQPRVIGNRQAKN